MAELAHRPSKQPTRSTSPAGSSSAPLGARSAVTQLHEMAARLNGRSALAPIQAKATPHNGLPANLKTGMEALSGIALDDVRVHRNSAMPAQLHAHAYAQGTDIHLAPGQEQHLPHEAWHVVQQKQGRVRPTIQIKGAAINDDPALEREADSMGSRAGSARQVSWPVVRASAGPPVVQGAFMFVGKWFVFDKEHIEKEMGGKALQRLSSVLGEPKRRKAILAKLEYWATCDEDVGFKGKTYEEVIRSALEAVNSEFNDDTDSKAQPRPIAKGRDDKVVEKELATPPMEKVKKLGELRRQASLAMIDLVAFRDTRQQQYIQHEKDDTQFSVGHTGNFLLGGNLPQDYKEIIAHIQLETGLTGAKLAAVLLDAMNGEETAVAQKGGIAKFVTLAYSSECRRAAINPLAIKVVLERVRGEGGDVFNALHDNVLCIAGGGSKQSQYHRQQIDADEHFDATAPKEYDAFVKAAAARGYDVSSPEAMNLFIRQMAVDHVLAHKILFLGHKRPEKKAAPQPGWTSTQVMIAIAVIGVIIMGIIALMKNRSS